MNEAVTISVTGWVSLLRRDGKGDAFIDDEGFAEISTSTVISLYKDVERTG